MCIFSGEVDSVDSTLIVVGKTTNNQVKIIYSNKVATQNNNIMILPVDTDNIELVHLDDKYETLNDDIYRNYNTYYSILHPQEEGDLGGGLFDDCASDSYEKIIKYGPYDVSKTKILSKINWNHFGGLKNKLRFIDFMYKKYPNYTFLIAKININENNGDNKIPICYEFIPKNINKVMLPTYHIHDGKPDTTPDWNHLIVCLNGKLIENIDKIEVPHQHICKYFSTLNDLFTDYEFEYQYMKQNTSTSYTIFRPSMNISSIDNYSHNIDFNVVF
jgi:hypothetical protein